MIRFKIKKIEVFLSLSLPKKQRFIFLIDLGKNLKEIISWETDENKEKNKMCRLKNEYIKPFESIFAATYKEDYEITIKKIKETPRQGKWGSREIESDKKFIKLVKLFYEKHLMAEYSEITREAIERSRVAFKTKAIELLMASSRAPDFFF